MVAIMINHGATINLHQLGNVKTWAFMKTAVISCWNFLSWIPTYKPLYLTTLRK